MSSLKKSGSRLLTAASLFASGVSRTLVLGTLVSWTLVSLVSWTLLGCIQEESSDDIPGEIAVEGVTLGLIGLEAGGIYIVDVYGSSDGDLSDPEVWAAATDKANKVGNAAFKAMSSEKTVTLKRVIGGIITNTSFDGNGLFLVTVKRSGVSGGETMYKNVVFSSGTSSLYIALMNAAPAPVPDPVPDPVIPDTVIYTVTFNLAYTGAPNPPKPQEIDVGGKVTLPSPAPTRADYTFGGWFADANFRTVWDFGKDTVTESIVLYAKWMPIDTITVFYTVTFNLNYTGAPEPNKQEAAGRSYVKMPADPERTGHIFGGWFKDTAGKTRWDFDKDIVTGAVSLYAAWTSITYTVRFLPNYTGALSPPIEASVRYGGAALAPATPPTRTGYTLDGWYREAACTSEWHFETDTVTGGLDLYAKWKPNTYTITFNHNYTGAPAQQTVANVPHGSTIAAIAATRTGYTLDGWYREATGLTRWIFEADIVTGAHVLYAKWTLNRYTVSFDTDGGSPVPSQTVDHGSLAVMPPPAQNPTKTGYAFGNWVTAKGGTTPFNFAAGITGNTTIHAGWLVLHTVKFCADDGEEKPEAYPRQSVPHGGTAVIPMAIGTEGGIHILENWYSDIACTAVYNFATPVNADMTLYVKWVLNMITVTFHRNGGEWKYRTTDTESIIAYRDYTPPTSAEIKRSGYNFRGWYLDSAGFQEFTGHVSNHDFDLYARWF